MAKRNKSKNNLLITGGLGFIGSHVVERFVDEYKYYFNDIIVVDKLTYAADKTNISEKAWERIIHYPSDISHHTVMDKIFKNHKITHVINLAAESHVDNSIENPMEFVKTNVVGTVTLLNTALKNWKDNTDGWNYGKLFYQISTDEVYGSLGKFQHFSEETPYDPKSPYSASKASADHFVRAYWNTYNLPVVISHCSNNYGPHQHEEKLIPKTIKKLLNGEKIPVYGKGENIRDWIYVEDHVDAITEVFNGGEWGASYNIGGDNEIKNIDLVKKLIILFNYNYCDLMGSELILENHIEFVTDRLGHDYRYAVDYSKIQNELYWKPKTNIDVGLNETVQWYVDKWSK
jgi:dTDP-glucose 4,6-dehydratase